MLFFWRRCLGSPHCISVFHQGNAMLFLHAMLKVVYARSRLGKRMLDNVVRLGQ